MITAGGLLSVIVAVTYLLATGPTDPGSSAGAAKAATAAAPPTTLERLAAEQPHRRVEVIAQLAPSADQAAAAALVRSLGGDAIARLEIIDGIAAGLTAGAAERLGKDPMIRSVSLNAAVESEGRRLDPGDLATAYNQSIRSHRAWNDGYTGDGVGVAVVDTGIAGDLPDFRESRADGASRVVATAVVNPAAADATDGFGHGTHIAGLIAGNGTNRAKGDPLEGRYIGVAPDADLISVKVADEDGNATVLDVIDGLQFVVDHQDDYDIRVVNLSLRSTEPESYLTDPLDAAVEAAWNKGIVVVAAAGNSGTEPDAVSYAPANDPHVITVGAVDDQSTKNVRDDRLASWSSRGVTQDGFAKPDVLAPGSGLVSTIPAGSDYVGLCPTCVTDGEYFRVGGTSMAAALVSGEAALIAEARPSWGPEEIKAQIVKRSRAVLEPSSGGELVDASGDAVVAGEDVDSTIAGGEAAVDKALNRKLAAPVNVGLAPNELLDPATGDIDFERASWSRASWSEAIDPLRASWSRASWSRASWSRASWSASAGSCLDFERASWSRASWSSAEIEEARDACSDLLAQIDPTRASWSRASWSRASWSTSFDK